MVKPSIHPEGGLKKDSGALLKDGTEGKETALPVFAVIPLRSEGLSKDEQPPVVTTNIVPVVSRPRKSGVGLCLLLGLAIILVVGIAVTLFVRHFSAGRHIFTCGVNYDDNDYLDYDRSAQTGLQTEHTLNEEVEVSPEEHFERIEVPEQYQVGRLTILHDFTVNMTAYRVWNSDVCYITWLDIDAVMGPREFIEKAEKNPYFLVDHYITVSQSYWALLPELESLEYGFGVFIPLLCSTVDSFWIEKIPESILEEEDEAEEEPKEDGHVEFPGVAPAPPLPEHRRRSARAADGSDEGSLVDKITVFTGKQLHKINIYKEKPQAKEAM